jgi:hypothetical protein
MIRIVSHLHSTYSYDGHESLADIKLALIERGISVACMTEHVDELTPEKAREFIAQCQALSDVSFLFIPGFEMPYLGTHILVIGAHRYTWDADNAQQSLSEWIDNGAIAVVAHPHRNDFQFDTFMRESTIGMEVWNSQYDGKYAPRPRALSTFTQLRSAQPTYHAFAGIDLHRLEHLGGPEIIMESSLEEKSILSALKNGNYHIQGSSVRIGSDAKIAVNSFGLWVIGMGSVIAITIGKGISRMLRKSGLGSSVVIKNLRRRVRRNL